MGVVAGRPESDALNMKSKLFKLVAFSLFLAQALLASANSQSPKIYGGAIPQAGASLSGIIWPRADVVFLDSENSLWIQRACRFGFRREITVKGIAGQLIGIDFRPADGQLYGLDDEGNLYTIDTLGNAAPFGSLTVPFGGDFRSLMDFNPVANALRLIGANDQNLALVGADLGQTVAQTQIVYARGDVNEGANPNLVGGAYTNNIAGATTTIFYGLDYGLHTLVTIAPPLANGSSATGGGQLQTIGAPTFNGRPFKLAPSADFDIFTVRGINYLIGVNDGQVFTIDLGRLRLPALGQTCNVPVRALPLPGDGFIDLAIGPLKNCD